jgi:hypothetical protein
MATASIGFRFMGFELFDFTRPNINNIGVRSQGFIALPSDYDWAAVRADFAAMHGGPGVVACLFLQVEESMLYSSSNL